MLNAAISRGIHAVICNDYLSHRTIQTAIGDVEIKVLKVKDFSDNGICFNILLLPPYLKHEKSRKLPPYHSCYYLRGITQVIFMKPWW
ncbi:MAG: hypothetical protein ACTS73_08440 [Arsenophonus sp. NEOnobi-MAG3]